MSGSVWVKVSVRASCEVRPAGWSRLVVSLMDNVDSTIPCARHGRGLRGQAQQPEPDLTERTGGSTACRLSDASIMSASRLQISIR